ncbi:SufE family protein, partial [Vibrio parahaemolyticus]|uniref:SufE family protein n=1 Tax=Vibrio parahaemolyticus TaxID=670 RepID=UPI00211334B1
WHFCADSDARIIRGLIALVMAAYDGKTADRIQAFDIDDYFEQLGLIAHLSPSRGNGLKAIVEQIKHTAV